MVHVERDDLRDVRMAAGIECRLWRVASAARPPLVLLHGIGSDASSWTRMMAELARDRDVVAWNAPGYGRSPPLGVARATVVDYLGRLRALVEALGLGKIVLVGHSLGALFAASYAAAFPADVVALGLLSPAAGLAGAPDAPMPARLQARLDDLARLGAAGFAASRAPRLVSHPDTRPDLVDEIRTVMARVRLPGYAHAVDALATGSLAAHAPQIACPTLVMVGVDDAVTPPASARAIRASLGGPSTYVELADVGHALTQQAPREAAEAIRRLCAEAQPFQACMSLLERRRR